jgi:hypothetical protein
MIQVVSSNPNTFVKVHTEALISLIFRPEVLLYENAPETLLFDVKRINDWHKMVSYISDG